MVGQHVDAVGHELMGGGGLLGRIGPAAGKQNVHLRTGMDALRPQREGVDIVEHLRNGMRGDKSELSGFRHLAGDDARQIDGAIDFRPIRAEVRGDRRGPAAVFEDYARIRRCEFLRVSIIAVTRGEDHLVTVLNHAFHDAVDVGVFRHVFDVGGLDAGNVALHVKPPLILGVIIAVVVDRPDVDVADLEWGICNGRSASERDESNERKSKSADYRQRDPPIRRSGSVE